MEVGRAGISPTSTPNTGPAPVVRITRIKKAEPRHKINFISTRASEEAKKRDTADTIDLTDSKESDSEKRLKRGSSASNEELMADPSADPFSHLFDDFPDFGRQDEWLKADSEKRLAQITKERDALVAAKVHADEERTKLIETNAGLRSKLANLRKELLPKEGGSDVAGRRIADLQVTNSDLRSKIAAAEMRHAETERKQELEIQTLKAELAQHVNAKTTLDEEVGPLRAEHDILRKKFDSAVKAHRALQELHDKTMKMDRDKARKATVEHAAKLLLTDKTQRSKIEASAVAIISRKEETFLREQAIANLVEEQRELLEQQAFKSLAETHPHVVPLIEDLAVAHFRADVKTKARCEQRITDTMVEEKALQRIDAAVAHEREIHHQEQEAERQRQAQLDRNRAIEAERRRCGFNQMKRERDEALDRAHNLEREREAEDLRRNGRKREHSHSRTRGPSPSRPHDRRRLDGSK